MILSIDVGTTSMKLGVYSQGLERLALSESAYASDTPDPFTVQIERKNPSSLLFCTLTGVLCGKKKEIPLQHPTQRSSPVVRKDRLLVFDVE